MRVEEYEGGRGVYIIIIMQEVVTPICAVRTGSQTVTIHYMYDCVTICNTAKLPVTLHVTT